MTDAPRFLIERVPGGVVVTDRDTGELQRVTDYELTWRGDDVVLRLIHEFVNPVVRIVVEREQG
jgi:hypothetical protein